MINPYDEMWRKTQRALLIVAAIAAVTGGIIGSQLTRYLDRHEIAAARIEQAEQSQRAIEAGKNRP